MLDKRKTSIRYKSHHRFYVVALVLCVVSCKHAHQRRNYITNDGLADNAITIIGSPDIDSTSNLVSDEEYDALLVPKFTHTVANQFLKRFAYIVSYNRETLNPNWVAWKLTREHTDGPYLRKGVPYYADNGTVYGIGIVTPETCKNGYIMDMEAEEPRQHLLDWNRDYNMSHGHMCPAGDNKWDKVAMNQSFLLTNMCPQDEKLNGGGWKKLEEKCRTWANQYGDIYIVAGPIFGDSITRTLGKGKIAIPDAFFKVILCMQGTPKAIGFLYKNDSSNQSIRNNVCSVDEIESISSFDFFYSLPDDVEESIESVSNLYEWN